MKILSVFICICMLFIVGCATGPVIVPERCENSLIYKYIPNPQQTGILLKMSNLAMIDSGTYTAEQAYTLIVQLRDYLNTPNLTYTLLAKVVSEEVAPYFILLGELVPQFAVANFVIDSCDLDLLRKHLDEQLAIVQLRLT